MLAGVGGRRRAMPPSPLKRPSAGGRLARLLASLRPPARAGPLPVQTGFPTSLADIVVRNYGRLKNPRRRHRAAPPSAEPVPVPQQRRDLPAAHDAAPAVAAAPPGKAGARFCVRPGLLVAGGAVALALLVIWSRQLVAAATLASVALSWIESAGTGRRRRPETTKEEAGSPVREAAESPRRSCAESDDGSSSDLGSDEPSSANNNPKRKQSRRSLRKLLANKLRNGRRPRDKDSRHGAGELPCAAMVDADPTPAAAPAEETSAAPPPEANAWCHRARGGALPLCALGSRGGALPFCTLVQVILVGLVAGRLPAVALAVLCAVLSSSVERGPAQPLAASGDLRQQQAGR